LIHLGISMLKGGKLLNTAVTGLPDDYSGGRVLF
jgi:hypothetical protein